MFCYCTFDKVFFQKYSTSFFLFSYRKNERNSLSSQLSTVQCTVVLQLDLLVHIWSILWGIHTYITAVLSLILNSPCVICLSSLEPSILSRVLPQAIHFAMRDCNAVCVCRAYSEDVVLKLTCGAKVGGQSGNFLWSEWVDDTVPVYCTRTVGWVYHGHFKNIWIQKLLLDSVFKHEFLKQLFIPKMG